MDNLRAMRILVDGQVIIELGAPEVHARWSTPDYADGLHTVTAMAAT